MSLHLYIIMLINAVELGTINTLLCLKQKKRNHFWLRCSLCSLLVVGYGFFFTLEIMGYFAFHLPLVFISFLYVGLCYEVNFLQTLFIGVAGYTIQHISSLINSIITVIDPEIFSHVSETGVTGVMGYILIIACDGAVYTAAYFIVARRFGKPELRKNATVPVVVLGAVVLITNQLWGIGIAEYGLGYVSTFYALMEYIWNLICCILSLIIQFNIFSISKKDAELEIIKKLIEEKERQYKMSKSNIDAINRKCHDLKYQMAALSAGQDSERHITEAMELVDSFDSELHTGNDTLDIIFTEKNNYCKKHNITFVCMIDGDKLNFMDVTDQYVMFGNIIDNAINAVRKLADRSTRSIYMNIHAEKQLLLIQTENPFVGELEFSDGLPRTSTGDDFNHGFGIGSIRLIAEKYGGSINTKAEDGIFYLNVLIPIKS